MRRKEPTEQKETRRVRCCHATGLRTRFTALSSLDWTSRGEVKKGRAGIERRADRGFTDRTRLDEGGESKERESERVE